MLPRSLAVGAGLAAMLAAVPASALAAPALAPLKPCYVSAGEASREPVAVTGSGFTPNSQVSVAVDQTVAAGTVQVDPAGAFTGTVKAPHQVTGERPFTVTATEVRPPGQQAIATSKVTALGITVRPRTARPSAKVRFRGSGFTAPAPIYAHYLLGDALRRTVRVAAPAGDCGEFTARRRQFPLRSPRTGRWTVQFDQQREYSPAPPIFVRLPIDVFRRPAG